MRKLPAYLILFLFISAGEAIGQEAFVLTLDQAINISLNKSYTVKAHQETKQAMQHYFKYWQAMFDPKLEFTVFTPSWNENVSGIQRVDGLPVYNSTGMMQYGSKLKFTYTLPSGGHMALGTEVYRENLKTVLALRDYEKLSTNQARSSISLSFDQPIFTKNKLKNINPEEAVSKALVLRSEIAERESDVELQDINLDRARRIREISGTISAYYDLTGVSTIDHGSMGGLFRSSLNNFADRPSNRGITLTFSYPVFDWGRGAQRVKQETANLREAQLTLDNTKTTIVREVRDIVRSVEEAKNRLEIHEKNEQLARKLYEISQMRFEHGGITSQELGMEQAKLTESQLGYLGAYITYQLALADLKRKTLWDFKENQRYQQLSFSDK